MRLLLFERFWRLEVWLEGLKVGVLVSWGGLSWALLEPKDELKRVPKPRGLNLEEILEVRLGVWVLDRENICIEIWLIDYRKLKIEWVFI